MFNIVNNIRGIVDQIPIEEILKERPKESNISKVAQASMNTGIAAESKGFTHVAFTPENVQLYDEIVEQLFAEVLGSTEEVTTQPVVDMEMPPKPTNLAINLMDLLSDRKLESRDKREIQKQIEQAVSYIEEKGDELRTQARDNNETLYLRPSKMRKGLGKKWSLFGGRGLKGRYKGAHLQINPDGQIYIIPKHPKLALGKGAYKKVRTALEVDSDNQPVRLVAFANLPVRNPSDRAFNKAEADLIRGVVKELNKSDPEAKSHAVRLSTFSRNVRVFRLIPFLKVGVEKQQMTLPFANRGDLKHADIQIEEIPDILRGVVDATATLHDLGINNGDIKPENFLLNDSEVMSFDLGLAESVGKSGQSTWGRGTPGYMAPEIWKSSKTNPYNAYAADMFALGRTLYEVGSRQPLSFIDSALSVKRDSRNREKLMFNSSKYMREWRQFEPKDKFDVLVKQMIHPDPDQRPTMETVKIALELVLNKDISLVEFTAAIDQPEELLQLYQDGELKQMTALFFDKREMDIKSQMQVVQQVKEGQDQIRENGEKWRLEAQELGEPIYIRPSDYGGRKIGKGKDKEARYRGAHIQVNPDGKIYLIPKHPKLWLGKGAAKKLRMAIEIDESGTPMQIVAYASVKKDASSDFKLIEGEVKTLDKLVKLRDEESPVSIQCHIFAERGKAKVVLPYADMGDLSRTDLTSDQRMQVMGGCVKWIEFLHNNDMVDFDTKRENFLGFGTPDGEIDVIGLDAGLVKPVGKDGMTIPPGGTPEYIAPEVFDQLISNLKSEEKGTCDGYKANIFSLGKTLYFLDINGIHKGLNFIWKDSSGDTTYSLNKYKLEWNRFEPKSPVQVLAKAMIHPDPKLRPDIHRVKELLSQIQEGSLSLEQLTEALQPLLENVDVEIPKKEASLEIPAMFTSGDIDSKLTEKGAWLLQQDENFSIFIHYHNMKTGEIEKMKIRIVEDEDLIDFIQFNIEEGLINQDLLVQP